MIRRCGKCHLEVRDEVTTNGVPIRLNVDPDPEGDYLLILPEDAPAEAQYVGTWSKELRAEAHRTQGLYRRHQETCDPLVLPIEGAA